MSLPELGEALANRWLATIQPFSKELQDTGTRFRGNPVFNLTYRWGTTEIQVEVYRFTPTNNQHSYLAFVPEEILR